MIAASHSGTSGLTSRTGRGVVADAAEHRHHRLRAEGGAARTHCVEHTAQAEQVGTRVDRLTAGLLGRHVLRRAGNGAALGQTGVVDRSRQAEIGDLDPLDPVLQQDIRRLDVAVDQSLRVGRGQSAGGLHADPYDLADRQRAVAVDPLLERPAGDVGHDEVGQSLLLVDGVDGHDVVVADRGRRPRLAGESPTRGGTDRELGGEDLECHEPVQGRVERLEHHAHPAPADDLDHRVLAELAEHPRLVRRFEELTDRLVIQRPSGRPGLADRRLGGEPAEVGPPAAPGRGRFEPVPA